MAKKSSAPVAPETPPPAVAPVVTQETPEIPAQVAKPRRDNLLKQQLRKEEDQAMQESLQKIYSPAETEEKADEDFIEEFDKVLASGTNDENEQENTEVDETETNDDEIDQNADPDAKVDDEEDDEIDDDIVRNPCAWITPQVIAIGGARGLSGEEIATIGQNGFIATCQAIDRRTATQQPESKKADTESQLELPPENAEELKAIFGEDGLPLVLKLLKSQQDASDAKYEKRLKDALSPFEQEAAQRKQEQADRAFFEFDGMFDVLSKQSPGAVAVFGKGIVGKDLVNTSKTARKQIDNRAEVMETFTLLQSKNPRADKQKLFERAVQIVSPATVTTSNKPSRTTGRATTKNPAYTPQQRGRNPKEAEAAKDAEFEREMELLQKKK